MENYKSDTLVERWEVVIAVGEHGGGGGSRVVDENVCTIYEKSRRTRTISDGLVTGKPTYGPGRVRRRTKREAKIA